jgi:two-component system, OmpR family, phosphate regulon sensor histidine kinase PhoR
MFKKIRGPIILIILILLLPTIIFSLYEIGTSRQNEQVIEEIYTNQLDAILFSVNQYSDDVMSSWSGKLKALMNNGDLSKKEAYEKFISEIPVGACIYNFDSSFHYNFHAGKDCTDVPSVDTIKELLVKNDSILLQLQKYIKAGYQKFESVVIPQSSYQLIVFACSLTDYPSFNVLVVNPQRFIREILDPKIQEISRDKFYIAAINDNNNLTVYNSDKQYRPESFEHRKPFWLIKDFSIAIELKDRTIADLARSRSRKDLLLIVIIDLVLFLGIWLIYRNVRKQTELSQLKSDFVSNVSHEIRTPLALISMYIETLEMGRVKTAEKAKEYYGIILQEAQRLTTIINKILNFSQIESGKRKYAFTQVQLNSIVTDVVSTFKVRLEKNEFICHTHCKDDLTDIQGDHEAITDSVVNLLDNAIKYSGDHKEIKISTGTKGKYNYVEVHDQGIGISENEQKHIFDKFYRVTEKNLALKAKGSGLGLTIVKHIMDAHNGRIEVESSKGKGSTFRLLFPTY